MKIAVEGCAHGELDAIYGTIQHIEKTYSTKIDLLLCCGDFQAVRNADDLQSVKVSEKYREMKDFHKYYSGEKVAPVMTIFIGGNHEASAHLQELTHGGWVAPNIYYLGLAGVVRYGGLRIGGLSGIFKSYDYQRGRYERPPYSRDMIGSIYHVREFDVFRLLQIERPIHIFMSHDWPQGILEHGDKEALFRIKPYLRAEEHELGSPAAMRLLRVLEPAYWFSAHMHAKFPALVHHEGGKTTRFLALSKVLRGQDFMQVLDIDLPGQEPLRLEYDPEWLLVDLATRHLRCELDKRVTMPSPDDPSRRRYDYRPSARQIGTVRQLAGGPDGLVVPVDSFVRTVVPHGGRRDDRAEAGSVVTSNPQQDRYLAMLQQLLRALDESTMAVQHPLPAELMAAVFAYLRVEDLKNCSMVCCSWTDLQPLLAVQEISFTNVQHLDVERGLAACPAVKTISISEYFPRAATDCFRAFVASSTTLRTIQFYGMLLAGETDELLRKLTPALAHSAVSRLEVTECNLNNSHCETICRILRTCSSLKALILDHNGFTDVSNIVEALAENTTLECLSLAGNGLEDDAALAFAAGLARNRAIRSLNLSGSITDAGVLPLLDIWRSHPTLTDLLLSEDRIGPSAAALVDAVRKQKKQ